MIACQFRVEALQGITSFLSSSSSNHENNIYQLDGAPSVFILQWEDTWSRSGWLAPGAQPQNHITNCSTAIILGEQYTSVVINWDLGVVYYAAELQKKLTDTHYTRWEGSRWWWSWRLYTFRVNREFCCWQVFSLSSTHIQSQEWRHPSSFQSQPPNSFLFL